MDLDADARATALAARQHGLLTFDQALACGLSPKQVKGRVSTGRWRTVVRGVHAVAGTPDTWRQRALAAQLAVAGADGVLSHVTAAAAHSLLAPSPLPHVTVPPAASARCPIGKVHRSAVPLVDRATVDGLRVTSVSRTLVDLASVLDRARLEAVVDDALCRQSATAESTLGALDRAGTHRRGTVLLRSVLDVWTEAIRPGSPAEVRLLRLLADLGLPTPVTQHEVRTPDGRFVARLDVAWPEHLAALEYDGRLFHGPRRIDHDERRRATLRALGWRIAVATKVDLQPGERRLAGVLVPWLGVAHAVAR
jgi:hypothetical protein